METVAAAVENIFVVEAAAKAFVVYNVYTALVSELVVDLMNNNLVLNVDFDDIEVAVVNQPQQRLLCDHHYCLELLIVVLKSVFLDDEFVEADVW